MGTKKQCFILVVDDERQVCEYIQAVLRRRGYKMASFQEPIQALEFLSANAEEVDLIVSDIVMPGIDGIELAKRAAHIRGDIPIILLSGYSKRLVDAASGPNVKVVLESRC
jgi:two-component SAPR family response regulator